ncbi:hypothetical protein ONA70_11715 [Micromonospora yasonensis]|uniref:hypothetical protein n=1 Tax=Micromonospora yasonensis TaxID=1128667 RepID=UPI0022329284|nr:hypothetical protein [Micromonospora yasonensis]MCW3840767.1 hypothetical protein [Micromonospora yasonensis]
MSYRNYDPDDQQDRFHTRPAAPHTPPTQRIAYVDVDVDHGHGSTPYTPPAAHYPQSTTPYAPPAAHYPPPPTPYAPPAYPPAPYATPAVPRQRGQTDAATIAARVVVGVTGSVAFIFALHVFFSLAKANQDNGFVQFVYVLAKVFVLGFGDVFTPNDAKIGLVLNYGLAALVYLVIGRLIARALRQ